MTPSFVTVRVVDAQFAFADQQHHARRGEHLGHAANPKQIAGLHRLLGRQKRQQPSNAFILSAFFCLFTP
jgi:hypothetical protein